MTELTKEYFEKHLDRQLKLNKEHFDEKLEELAQSVAVGFRGVDERFDKVEGRLGAVESRLSNVEKGLLNVEKKQNEFDKSMRGMEKTQGELVRGVTTMEMGHRKESQEATLLRGFYHRLDDRVTKLEGAQV